MTEFDQRVAEVVQTGATAALVLDAVKIFSEECVELVLKRIDDRVGGGLMTPELAMGLVSEIAAFRRIVQRIKTKAQQGKNVREFNERATPSSA